FEQRGLHLAHDSQSAVTFALEVDRAGNGTWTRLRDVTVPARGYGWTKFSEAEKGAWVRVRPSADCTKATAFFSTRNRDRRGTAADARFAGLLRQNTLPSSGGLLHARGDNKRTLGFAAIG